MKTDTESKRCKSCTHQGEKAMTGKCFTCYDYENYEGCDAVEPVEDKQTCDNCGQDHKYCEPTNKEQFGFCGNWAEHQ